MRDVCVGRRRGEWEGGWYEEEQWEQAGAVGSVESVGAEEKRRGGEEEGKGWVV